MSKKPYDFCGWATRNNVKCSDGRTIRKDAFKTCDGQEVPLIWNHRHDTPLAVIGHCLLENRDEGVFMYGYLNETENANAIRAQLKNGDIKALSIYANELRQKGADVMHGIIREVSLVLAGANPKARIEDIVLAHGEDEFAIDGEAIIVSGEQEIELYHSDDKKEEEVADKDKKPAEEGKGEEMSAEELKKRFNEMSDDDKNVVYTLVGMALNDKKTTDDEDEEEEDDMKHNVFEGGKGDNTNVLCHADQQEILELAKAPGMSLKSALSVYAEENGLELMHDGLTSSGFTQDTTVDGNITYLFPEYKDYKPGAPELITNDRGWVNAVISGATKLPYSRVRTRHVDIRKLNDLRARGYQKGEKKDVVGNYTLGHRETDPQTIYVESELERDDVVDITDFDYVQWQYNIDRWQLEEELATAIMLGDSRADGVKGKIYPTHIRPIWTDDELYSMHYDIDIEAARETLQGEETGGYFGEEFLYSEALIKTVLDASIDRLSNATPSMWISPWMKNKLMLARDRNGRRIRANESELASEIGVNKIHTVQQFANMIRTDSRGNQHKLLAIIGNMGDYGVGSTKGGQITHFTDFDIKFNQLISLIETRLSGALLAIKSFIVIEEPYTAA